MCSIDPPGCTDIDDALHCVKLPNGASVFNLNLLNFESFLGNLEIGVHIADVAHYVDPDCALNDEAAHRGTSVYLVERRIDMLPSILSTSMNFA